MTGHDSYDRNNGAAKESLGHGTVEMLRMEIGDLLWFIGRTAEAGLQHNELLDDHGVAYSLRRLHAYLNALDPTVLDLLRLNTTPQGREDKIWTEEDPS